MDNTIFILTKPVTTKLINTNMNDIVNNDEIGKHLITCIVGYL